MSEVTGEIMQFLHDGAYYQIQVSASEIHLFVDGKVIIQIANMGSILATKYKDARIAELESAIKDLLERDPRDENMLPEYRTDICAYCDEGHFEYYKPMVHMPDCKYMIARKLVGADGE